MSGLLVAPLQSVPGWRLASADFSAGVLRLGWASADGSEVTGFYEERGAKAFLRFAHFTVRYEGRLATGARREDVAVLLQQTGEALERAWRGSLEATLAGEPARAEVLDEAGFRAWLGRWPGLRAVEVPRLTLEGTPADAAVTLRLEGGTARLTPGGVEGDAASHVAALALALKLRPLGAAWPTALSLATFETSALHLTLLVAFWSGFKPAMRWASTAQEQPAVLAWARRCGFFAEAGPGLTYIARTAELAKELAEVEARVFEKSARREPSSAEQARLGSLLGFPKCCVDGFVALLERGIDRAQDGRPASEYFVTAQAAAARSASFHPWLNDLSERRALRLVQFFPCRYDCPAAIAWAGAVREAMQRLTPRAVPALEGLAGTMRVGREGGFGAGARGEVLELRFTL